MTFVLAALLPLAGVALAQAQAATDTSAKVLDVSAATGIVVTGEASALTLTSSADKPYQVTVTGRRKGPFVRWYSSWFLSDCQPTGKTTMDGPTLRINVAPPSWLDPSDCVVEIVANLPPESSVSIRQAALQANLTGAFSAIDIDGNAADVTLQGHAQSVKLRSDAARAHLVFDTVKQDETVAINAKALDAYLSFGKDVPISYSVNASAASVDSTVTNVPGAKPSVTIDGDFVRATIR